MTGHARGQTEPLAALGAVAVVCLAVGLYAGSLTGVSTNSDRTLAEPALDTVWQTVASDGTYNPHDDPDPLETIRPEQLPDGKTVAITVTTGDERAVTVGSAVYVRGQYVGPTVAGNPDLERPSTVDSHSRPVPVVDWERSVSTGVLTVEVWD